MEKRLPLALALSILFVMLYLQSVPRPDVPEGGELGDPAAVSASDGGPAGGSAFAPGSRSDLADRAAHAGAADAAGGDANGAANASADAAGASLPEAPLREEQLSSDDQTSRWTSRGAALTQLELNQYHATLGNDDPLPLLDVLDGQHPNLLLRDVRDVYALDRVSWELERDDEGLVFTRRTADGLLFTRKVRLGSAPYVHELSLSVTNEGSERLSSLSLVLQGARGLVDRDASSRFYGRPTAVAILEGQGADPEIISWSDSDLVGEGRSIAEGERLLATGTMTNYFASVLAPVGDTDVRQVLPLPVMDELRLQRMVDEQQPADPRQAARLRAELADDVPEAAATELQLLVLNLGPGETQLFDFSFFAGPKSVELTKEPGLSYLLPVIEKAYGNMAWINRTLLSILRFFHGVFGNWGVAIILLTLLVRGFLFPINRRQQTSMQRYSSVMQKLKPQLEELKTKYKNNKSKFQQEQMKLLKEHGATPPLGGCLLMFLQFPIWISLFQILGTSIELRQSSFGGWINDLSRPDAMPFGFFGLEAVNLLPILMALATIVQMRSQPKAGDEQQQQTQKIMGSFMPLLMLWFLYSYSAGLSLYILTSSLLGIFEMRVIKRIWPVDGKPVPVGRPASGKAA
ncbi:MAG: hypothetical protein DRQ55_12180 [Planctomycetota bacterium]|nr:MAG: hypothetical protein DRQ55_12180 [Planctomycetota bacterium]